MSPTHVSHSCLESFAVDSKILKAISCVDDTALLQQDLVNVSQWSQENSMVLHDRKLELLCHLSDKDNSLHQLPFTYELYNYTTSNGVTISPSTTVKDLGVIISSDLSWHHHISTDTRIIRGHRLPISRYRDKLFATYRGQIAVLKIVDFFTTPAFLSPSKSMKSQATKYTAFKTNSVLNKHRISRNQWTANSLSFGAERSGSYGVYYCKIHTC